MLLTIDFLVWKFGRSHRYTNDGYNRQLIVNYWHFGPFTFERVKPY